MICLIITITMRSTITISTTTAIALNISAASFLDSIAHGRLGRIKAAAPASPKSEACPLGKPFSKHGCWRDMGVRLNEYSENPGN